MSKAKQNECIRPRKIVTSTTTISEQQIAERAYALYLARGAEHGHDVDDWLQAEQQLCEPIGSPTAA